LEPKSSIIADIRTDYRQASLDEETAGTDPIAFFSRWFAEAQTAQIYEVNAMTLATAGAGNTPHARIVLLKGLDERGFIFFTNYKSNKGSDLDANPKAALVFFWKELERQVRIEGTVEKVSAKESDTYFNSRPLGSRIGAAASPQSQVIKDRQELEDVYAQTADLYKDKSIARPDFWGGYRIQPTRIEFWQGRSSRLHDRIVFTANENGGWNRSRLAP
jgi:pyridoxamine 5'-phosphate oxidase